MNMLFNKRNRLFTLCVILLMMLAACGYSKAKEVDLQDLVGIWREDSKSCEEGLSDCAWVELAEDGQLEVHNLHSHYFGYWPDHENFFFNATGRWEIESPYPSENYSLVRLHFDEESMKHLLYENAVLYIESNWERNLRLFAWSSDPSNRITFIKRSMSEEE